MHLTICHLKCNTKQLLLTGTCRFNFLYTVKEDKAKLTKILTFLETEIYENPDQEEEIQVPEKFQKVVTEIAENIDAGITCFLNLDTLEMEEIHENELELYYDDPDD